MYTDMQLWTDVRRFVLVEKGSKREACRIFNIHWDTLCRILEHSEPPGYRQKARRPKTMIGPFMPIIEQILEDDKHAPRKQRHTSKRIWERLRDEHGFAGGYTVVKDAVRAWKNTHQETFVPLKHPLAEAQVDYGFAHARIGGVEQKIAIFVMSLPYSDAFFVKAYPRECTETFQDGHVQAFRFFGGVPVRISYDNSRVAVAKITGTRSRELTAGFLRLQSHYLYEEHFCRVRKANEKGHVENLVAYARNNFLVPMPDVASFDALNQHLAARCQSDLTRSIRGKDGIKQERLYEEQAAFLPLPKEDFDARRIEHRRANSLSLIRFDRNDYSVPVSMAHQPLTVKGGIDHIDIFNKDEIIASHPRDWGKEQIHFNPVHYLALLERKPGAFDYARPLSDWELPTCFELLRKRLVFKYGNQGMRHYIKVLRLLETHSLSELELSVREGLRLGTLEHDAIRLILQRSGEKPVKLFNLDGRPHLQGIDIGAPELNHYRHLLTGGEQ